MITRETIDRINQLAKKQREEGLAPDEKDEQAKLRRLYIDHIKGQVKTQLDASLAAQHSDHCDCGCRHKH